MQAIWTNFKFRETINANSLQSRDPPMDAGTMAFVTSQVLYETGPATLMRQLLRRFWQPVVVSADIAAGAARPVTP